jgi:hypothetical protein
MFRYTQIKEEGNDPSKTGKSFGTAHDIASLYKGNEGLPTDKYDETIPKAGEDKKDVSSATPPKLGRPPEHETYGTHEHPLGQDPLGAKAISTLAERSSYANIKLLSDLKKTFKDNKKPDQEFSLLNESNIIDDDDEPNS